jgi:hypothetical protein
MFLLFCLFHCTELWNSENYEVAPVINEAQTALFNS